MPRWVISSPIHISSTQPAVRQKHDEVTVPSVESLKTGEPALLPCERKRKT